MVVNAGTVLEAPPYEAGAESVATLVGRATGRDHEAFGRLYEMYAGRVYRHVYYMVQKKEEAEDITAQAFLQAWQAIERYRPSGAPFLAWLLRIAHNLVISRFRSRREQLPLEEWRLVADGDSLPETVCEAKDDGERLRQAIMNLKDVYRQVVVLRFVDDMDYQEVAAIMGRSVAAVRVIQHRALASLRRMMKETDDG